MSPYVLAPGCGAGPLRAWLFDRFAPIHNDMDGPCLEGWITLVASPPAYAWA